MNEEEISREFNQIKETSIEGKYIKQQESRKANL